MAAPTRSQGQLQEFKAILSRRRWQVLLPAAFVITGGIVFAVIAPRKYTVTTRVELRETSIEHDPMFDDPEGSATTRELDNIEHHIRHNERIAEIIGEELDQWPRYLNADYRGRREYIRDKVIKNLTVNVQFRPHNRGSTFVDIGYTDSDVVRAERFLTKLIDSWVDNVVERDRNTIQNELDILQNQVSVAEAAFNTLNTQYVQLTKDMSIDPSQPLVVGRAERAADPFWLEIQSLEATIQDVKTDLAQAEGELADVEQKLADTPPEIPESETIAGLGMSQQVAEIETKILDFRKEKEALRPNHSHWRRLERDIADLESQAAELRLLESGESVVLRDVPNPNYVALIATRDEKEVVVGGLRSQLGSLTERLAEAYLRAQKRSDDYGELFEIFGKLDTAGAELKAKLEAQNDKELTMALITGAWAKPYDIVDPPAAPEAPSEPNVWLILTFATLAGIALGVIVATIAEFGRPGFRSVGELSHAITVPVLGAINAVVTEAERQRERRRRTVVGASCAVILVGLLTTTYLWHSQKGMLPTELLQAIDDLQYSLM